MYGLKRALFAAAAPSPIRLPVSFPFTRSFCSGPPPPAAATGDLVYVGKGYKICGKDEIEGEISESYTHCQRKLNNERKVLPPELHSRTVARLTCESAADGGICDVYVVGSDHFCQKSWREVQNVIEFLKPQAVFLELCSRRLHTLTGQQLKVPTMGEMFDMWKKNEDPFWILFKWFHAKNDSKHGYVVGGDFCVAYEEAMKYGSKVILGDRPAHITLRRVLAKMSPWEFLFHPHSVAIPEDLLKTAKDDMDFINLVAEEVGKKFPTYREPYIERERYMSAKILEVAREHNSVVAVVGKAHLAGIQKYWKQHVDVKEILNIPSGKYMGKILNTFGAMVVFLSLSASQKRKIAEIIATGKIRTTADPLKNT